MCINVPLSPSFMSSQPLVRHLIEKTTIFTATCLCICLTTLIVLNIDLNCRYLSFNTCLNTLPVSLKVNKTENLYFLLLFISYNLIFEYYFIVFLPCDFWKIHLDTKRIIKKSVAPVKMFHCIFANTTLDACFRVHHLVYTKIVRLCKYPLETFAIWIYLMRLALCPDIHPNPGPPHSINFTGGFFIIL